MIVCPNCNHQNPDGATQCEACYTPLPATASCPNCGAPVQTDAAFCGQCGTGLQPSHPGAAMVETVVTGGELIPPTVVSVPPKAVQPDPIVEPEPLVAAPNLEKTGGPTLPSSPPQPLPTQPAAKTQLQQQTARLLHVQTNTLIELPTNLSVIHLGKPNDAVPPDVDVSGYPNSEIVSRVHADIRVEGDAYYLEDVGSSNGTYINNTPLPKGNRHRLRPGDRLSLGKGDLVTFLFQQS